MLWLTIRSFKHQAVGLEVTAAPAEPWHEQSHVRDRSMKQCTHTTTLRKEGHAAGAMSVAKWAEVCGRTCAWGPGA